MIIKYAVTNFRSFKNRTTLSMVAGPQTTLNENLIRQYGYRLLPSVVLYGANASGKSNLIMSLAVMKQIVLAGTLESNHPDLNNLELYPFVHNGHKEPMSFELEFFHKGYHVLYGIELSCDSFKTGCRRIEQEWFSLFQQNGKEINIFRRDQDGLQLYTDAKALRFINQKKKLVNELENMINANLDDAELFLSRAFKSTVNHELADVVLDYFKEKLVVVSDFTLKKATISFMVKEMPEKDYYAWNEIIDGFVKNADFGPQGVAFRLVETDEEESADAELMSFYKQKEKNIAIPSELMESRGTLKLIDFAIPFVKLFRSGGVFVLDEFDSAIHPELIRGIISLFNNQDINKAGAQLIFTTHNPIYLNNKIFRRDQVLFIEKDTQKYESVLYSLADFGSEEVRNDHNYLLNYFKGNYGALPYVDFSKLINGNNNNMED